MCCRLVVVGVCWYSKPVIFWTVYSFPSSKCAVLFPHQMEIYIYATGWWYISNDCRLPLSPGSSLFRLQRQLPPTVFLGASKSLVYLGQGLCIFCIKKEDPNRGHFQLPSTHTDRNGSEHSLNKYMPFFLPFSLVHLLQARQRAHFIAYEPLDTRKNKPSVEMNGSVPTGAIYIHKHWTFHKWFRNWSFHWKPIGVFIISVFAFLS